MVLEPAEQTPASVHMWLSLEADLLSPGVVNIVNGFGAEAGKPLASSRRREDRVHREDHDGEADRALEGFRMFALNQGEVCTGPSRALIQRGHYGELLEAGIARTEQVVPGRPLDADTMIGAQASNGQLQEVLSYLDIDRQEGAKDPTGGERIEYDGELAGGCYVRPTISEGDNRMRVFQVEIFGYGPAT